VPNLPVQENVDKNNRITIDTAMFSNFCLSQHQVLSAGPTIGVPHLFLISSVFLLLLNPEIRSLSAGLSGAVRSINYLCGRQRQGSS
jgi:hypothetical protein